LVNAATRGEAVDATGDFRVEAFLLTAVVAVDLAGAGAPAAVRLETPEEAVRIQKR
jgi:hypothetical protein